MSFYLDSSNSQLNPDIYPPLTPTAPPYNLVPPPATASSTSSSSTQLALDGALAQTPNYKRIVFFKKHNRLSWILPSIFTKKPFLGIRNSLFNRIIDVVKCGVIGTGAYLAYLNKPLFILGAGVYFYRSWTHREQTLTSSLLFSLDQQLSAGNSYEEIQIWNDEVKKVGKQLLTYKKVKDDATVSSFMNEIFSPENLKKHKNARSWNEATSNFAVQILFYVVISHVRPSI